MNEELKREASIITNKERAEEVKNMYEASREIDDKYHDRQLAIKVFHAADVFDGVYDNKIESLIDENIDLHDKMCKAEEKIKAMQEILDDKDIILLGREMKIEYRDGMIEGLKFALRCNGISGGDVQ